MGIVNDELNALRICLDNEACAATRSLQLQYVRCSVRSHDVNNNLACKSYARISLHVAQGAGSIRNCDLREA